MYWTRHTLIFTTPEHAKAFLQRDFPNPDIIRVIPREDECQVGLEVREDIVSIYDLGICCPDQDSLSRSTHGHFSSDVSQCVPVPTVLTNHGWLFEKLGLIDLAPG